MKKKLIVVLRSLLRSLILIIIIVTLAGPYVFLNSHIHVKRRHNIDNPSDYGMKYSHITTRSSDGILLDGWYIPVEEIKDLKGTIIACHGVGANKSNILAVTQILHNSGYEVYQFDFRGHGESGDAIITYGYNEKKDLKAIIDYAKKHGAKKIGLFGLSMGGAIVILSAPENPEVRVIVADSAYASVVKVMKYRMGHVLPWPLTDILASIGKFYSKVFFNIPMDQITPINAVKKIHHPILFIVGDQDTNITPDNGCMLHNAANKPKELLVIKGVGHTGTMHSAEFKKKVIQFLNKFMY